MQNSPFYPDLLRSAIIDYDHFIDLLQKAKDRKEEMNRSARLGIGIINEQIKQLPKDTIGPIANIQQIFRLNVQSPDYRSFCLWWNSLLKGFEQCLAEREKYLTAKLRAYVYNSPDDVLTLSSAFKDRLDCLKKYKYPALQSFIEASTIVSPIPSLSAHYYQSDFFTGFNVPIDSKFLADFISTIYHKPESTVELNLNAMIDYTKDMRFNLFSLYTRAETGFLLSRLQKEYPDRASVESTQLYKQKIVQIPDDVSVEGIKVRDELVQRLTDFNTIISQSIEMARNIGLEYMQLTSRDASLTLQIKLSNHVKSQLDSMSNHQKVPLINEKLHEWAEIQSNVINQIHNLLYIDPEKAIDQFSEILESLYSISDELGQMLKDVLNLENIKDQLQQRVMTQQTRKSYDDSNQLRYNKIRDFSFQLQDLLDKHIGQFSINTSKLQESLRMFAATVPPVQEFPRDAYDALMDRAMVEWADQVRSRLIEIRDQRAEELSNQREPLPSENEEEEHNEIVFDNIEAYNEMLQLTSCAKCEHEASYCIGVCGHLICQKCAEVIQRDEVPRCPICQEIIPSPNDIIKIEW